MAIMGVREYARHRNTGHSTVQRAIESGRISTLANGQIDSEVADREWTENTEGRPKGTTRRRETADDRDAVVASGYAKSRAIREYYEAKMAEIAYKEKLGSLIATDEVKIATFNQFRQFRDGILNIADRVAAMVAAESDAAKCYKILADEFRKALGDYADSPVGA